jgi:hypothetical protein
MLLQIRDFIHREHVVSTQQLAREFQMDEHALAPILQLWVNRGTIRMVQEKAGCKSLCSRCNNKPTFYTFVRN